MASAPADSRASVSTATGALGFARFGAGGLDVGERSAAAAAERFLLRHAAAFGATVGADELRLRRTTKDALGTSHFLYSQTYRAVTVFGARIGVHVGANGRVIAANASLVPSVQVSTDVRITAKSALRRARREVRRTRELASAGRPRAVVGDLVVFRSGLVRGVPGRDHLAFVVEVRQDPALHEEIFVDASSGKIVERISLRHEALSREVYRSEYRTSDLVWSEGDALPYGDGDIDELLAATAELYDVVANLSDGAYLSYDGEDATMIAVAHLDEGPLASICPNAFWNGATTNFCTGVATDDIVAHEWTHAYTQHTGGLIYQWQPGALNEAYSDIFGEIVDLTNGRGGDSPDVVRGEGTCTGASASADALEVVVENPLSIAATYVAGGAEFGAAPSEAGTAGELALADDGDDLADPTYGPGSTSDACEPLVGDFAGRIVLADRGGCLFVTKASNAQAAGAAALVVANNQGDAILTMSGSDPSIAIPCLFIGRTDGQTIRAEIGASPVEVRLRRRPLPLQASARWLVSEDSTGFGGAIRDMWTPECRNDPGRTGDVAHYACGSGDSGGVHTNSMVPGHAFALLVDGGEYRGTTVPAIGLVKAAHVYWRAMSLYQVPTTDFADHADALEQSCDDLIGAPLADPSGGAPSGETIDAADCAAVAAAIAAVEMRADPAGCSFAPLLDPDSPPICAGADATTVFFEDFESDPGASWQVSGEGVYAEYVPRDWAWRASLPGSRAGRAMFADDAPDIGDCRAGSDDQSRIVWLTSPAISLPAGIGVARLSFTHYVATEALFDGGRVEISVNGGPFSPLVDADFGFNAYNANLRPPYWPNPNPLANQRAFSGTDEGSLGGSWGESQVDLGWYARGGDVLRLRFAFGADGCGGSDGWYVDDVRVFGCQEPVGAVDPFVCYASRRTSRTPAFAEIGGVTIATPIDQAPLAPAYRVRRERTLCAPTEIEGASPLDAETHLAGYELRVESGEETRQDFLRVDTRFGRVWLKGRGANALLTPAAVSDTGPPPAPADDEHDLDSYRCERVKKARGAPKFAKGLTVATRDSFGHELLHRLLRPSRLCLAAEVDGVGPKDPAGAYRDLLCYRAKPAPGQGSLPRISGLETADLFGALTVDAVRAAEVCAPATVSVHSSLSLF